jgi:DNA modification methylase
MTDRRANGLDGRAWMRNSISIWSDLGKTGEEAALRHPAMFPMALPNRLMDCFTIPGPGLVLDPFAGTGSTPLAACLAGKRGVGIELSSEYVDAAMARYRSVCEGAEPPAGEFEMIHARAESLLEHVSAGSVDLCVTSPPYWNILERRRSADHKAIRDYGGHEGGLGTVGDYQEFLDALQQVFALVYTALKPGGYCCTVVMDIRKGPEFYPFHSDLAARQQACGLIYDDLVIWDRRLDYNMLRPLGFPAVFRINKVHEFIIIARKPR